MIQQDTKWLRYIIELSKQCPPSTTAFAVGAVLVDDKGNLLADGFSRETDSKIHAEEALLQKIHTKKIALVGATLYSSLEPCNKRLSRPKGCAQLIIEAGIKRVVFAALEPPLFVPGEGKEKLTAAGVSITYYEEYLPKVIAVQSFPIQKKWK